MDSIFGKIKKSDVFSEENRASYITAVALMSLFTFTFLGAEFLFVNVISRTVSGDRSVNAQNYALGVSVVGFALYPLFCRIFKEKLLSVISVISAVISVACLFLMCRHSAYELTLSSGLLLFLILGVFGSAVFYKAVCLLKNNAFLARLVGLSYMLGILLQIANNNLIHADMSEAGVLSAFVLLLSVMLIKARKSRAASTASEGNTQGENNKKDNSGLKIGVVLVLFVALMTCIFGTLDNAVTLYHANGVANIGQWHRILLALSGLLAGFLFDVAKRKYMGVIMYCVMILSTACLVILQFAGPFSAGLAVFYLSAGFFAVFFTASFMELSQYTNTPQLWAGLGRAVNNLVAMAISGGSLALLNSGNNIAIITGELLLFVLTSITALIYTVKRRELFERLDAAEKEAVSSSERLERLSEKFSFTPREAEVFGLLVSTEDGLQTIADNLFISRRTLERYVSAIYEKTGAKTRIGLISLFNNSR